MKYLITLYTYIWNYSEKNGPLIEMKQNSNFIKYKVDDIIYTLDVFIKFSLNQLYTHTDIYVYIMAFFNIAGLAYIGCFKLGQ